MQIQIGTAIREMRDVTPIPPLKHSACPLKSLQVPSVFNKSQQHESAHILACFSCNHFLHLTRTISSMTDLAIKNTTSSQLPKKTLYFYRRIHQGRKNLFAPSDTAPADYFILNRIPHKHHWTWTPTFHRGDNPKYTPSTVATSRARRSSWWSSFRIWLGDGVDEVLRNEARVRARKKVRFGKRAWKFLGARKKAQAAREEEEGLEEEKEVLGLVMLVKMRRKGVWSRTAEWEVDGVGYRWSGTRRFMTGWMKGVKGWSHDLKVGRIV